MNQGYDCLSSSCSRATCRGGCWDRIYYWKSFQALKEFFRVLLIRGTGTTHFVVGMVTPGNVVYPTRWKARWIFSWILGTPTWDVCKDGLSLQVPWKGGLQLGLWKRYGSLCLYFSGVWRTVTKLVLMWLSSLPFFLVSLYLWCFCPINSILFYDQVNSAYLLYINPWTTEDLPEYVVQEILSTMLLGSSHMKWGIGGLHTIY